MKLGKIEEVKLREIWKNEAGDFTPRLAEQENLDILGDVLGLDLIEAEKEVAVGNFNCDIRCKVGNDNRIVAIENQVEQSDHDHLGKSIVYASGINASIIIRIVRNARDEHISAIERLNEHTDGDVGFFLVEIHAIKIDESKPAPLFKIITQPNEYVKSIKASQNKELNRSKIGRYEFWSQMNEYINTSNLKLRTRKPNYDHWYNFSLGSSQYHLTVNLLDRENKIRIALWIINDKAIYEKLFANKDKLENMLGELEWDKKEEAKASQIADYINGFSFDITDNRQELFKLITKKIMEFQKAFKPFLS